MTMTMTRNNISTFTILSFLLFVGDGRVVEAFQQSHPQQHPRHPSQPPQPSRTTTTTTALQLQEGQGQFLKAAYECSTCAKVVVEAEDTAARLHLHTEDEYTHLPAHNNDDEGASHSKWRAVASSKSFLTRVFHKKSVPHPILDAPPIMETNIAPPKFSVASFLHTLSHPPSEVFHGVDVHAETNAVYYPLVGFQFVAGCTEVLPTIQRASIPLPTKQQHDEVTFGWFSAACPLDVYADDETFGHPPVVPHDEHQDE